MAEPVVVRWHTQKPVGAAPQEPPPQIDTNAILLKDHRDLYAGPLMQLAQWMRDGMYTTDYDYDELEKRCKKIYGNQPLPTNGWTTPYHLWMCILTQKDLDNLLHRLRFNTGGDQRLLKACLLRPEPPADPGYDKRGVPAAIWDNHDIEGRQVDFLVPYRNAIPESKDPYLRSGREPTTNWGYTVFSDGRAPVYSCCGQPYARATLGCWIQYGGNQFNRDPIPYDFAPGLRNIDNWREMSAQQRQTLWDVNSIQRGTAWLNKDYYDEIHQKIVILVGTLKDPVERYMNQMIGPQAANNHGNMVSGLKELYLLQNRYNMPQVTPVLKTPSQIASDDVWWNFISEDLFHITRALEILKENRVVYNGALVVLLDLANGKNLDELLTDVERLRGVFRNDQPVFGTLNRQFRIPIRATMQAIRRRKAALESIPQELRGLSLLKSIPDALNAALSIDFSNTIQMFNMQTQLYLSNGNRYDMVLPDGYSEDINDITEREEEKAQAVIDDPVKFVSVPDDWKKIQDLLAQGEPSERVKKWFYNQKKKDIQSLAQQFNRALNIWQRLAGAGIIANDDTSDPNLTSTAAQIRAIFTGIEQDTQRFTDTRNAAIRDYETKYPAAGVFKTIFTETKKGLKQADSPAAFEENVKASQELQNRYAPLLRQVQEIQRRRGKTDNSFNLAENAITAAIAAWELHFRTIDGIDEMLKSIAADQSEVAQTAAKELGELQIEIQKDAYDVVNRAQDAAIRYNGIIKDLPEAKKRQEQERLEAERRKRQEESDAELARRIHEKEQGKAPPPPEHVFPVNQAERNRVVFDEIASGGLLWDENSCWADAVLMALFKIPGLWLERRIRNSTSMTLVGENCDQKYAQDLKTAVIGDINVLQGSDRKMSVSRTLWQKCVRRAVQCNAKGEAASMKDDLLKLFRLTDDVENGFISLLANTGDMTWRQQFEFSPSPRVGWIELPRDRTLTQYQLTKFTLSAIVYGGSGPVTSGGAGIASAGHFTAAVRNPKTRTWTYEDSVSPKTRKNDMPESDIFVTEGQTATFKIVFGYTPLYVIYFSNRDLDQVQRSISKDDAALMQSVLDEKLSLDQFGWDIERATKYNVIYAQVNNADELDEWELRTSLAQLAPRYPITRDESRSAKLLRMIPRNEQAYVRLEEVPELVVSITSYLTTGASGEVETDEYHDLRIYLSQNRHRFLQTISQI